MGHRGLIFFIIASFSTASWAAERQSHMPPPPAEIPVSKKASSEEPVGFELGFATGVANFQDIQVPESYMRRTRADGAPIGQETQDHIGFPLSASMGYHYSFAPQFSLGPTLSATRVIGITGPPETTGSSYERYDGMLAARYAYSLSGGWNLKSEFSAGARRVLFRSIYAAHYIDAVPLALSVDMERSNWTFGLMTSRSVAPQFGYLSEGRSGRIAGSAAHVYEIGGRVAWQFYPHSYLDLALLQERADVTIENVQAYQSFGLIVTRSGPQSRYYQLETTLATIGLRRAF